MYCRSNNAFIYFSHFIKKLRVLDDRTMTKDRVNDAHFCSIEIYCKYKGRPLQNKYTFSSFFIGVRLLIFAKHKRYIFLYCTKKIIASSRKYCSDVSRVVDTYYCTFTYYYAFFDPERRLWRIMRRYSSDLYKNALVVVEFFVISRFCLSRCTQTPVSNHNFPR